MKKLVTTCTSYSQGISEILGVSREYWECQRSIGNVGVLGVSKRRWECRRSIGSERKCSSHLNFADCPDQSINTKERFPFLDKFGCVNVTQIGESSRNGANLFTVAFKDEVFHLTEQIGQFC